MAAAFYGHVACYPGEYRSGTLAVIARSGGLRPWAAIITAAALAVLVTRGPTAVIVLGAALCGWSAGLLAAVATGETLSPAGPCGRWVSPRCCCGVSAVDPEGR